MGVTQESRLLDIIENTTFVDCDVHAMFRSDELAAERAQRMDEPYRSYLDPGSEKYSGDILYPTLGRSFSDYGTQPTEVAPVTSAEDLDRELCQKFHVDHPIINILSGINPIQNTDRALQEVSAVNDMVIEEFLDEKSHFFGTGTVYPHEPDEAAEEIDRIASEDQIVGVLIIDTGVMTPLGDPKYDVIYQAAEDNDLPVVFHSTSDAETAREFPSLAWEVQKWITNHTLCHPFSHMLTMASMMFQGVPEKFPDLNFVFVEAGFEWVPWFTARMNREYNQRPGAAPLLTKQPEAYVNDQFYFGNQPLSEPMRRGDQKLMTDLLDSGSIVGVTDFPHTDWDTPATLLRNVSHLSEEEINGVLHGNAIEAFGLNI